MTSLTGLAVLLRLALRRDRVLLGASVSALVAFAVGSSAATIELYPSATAAKQGMGQLLQGPATRVLYGPASDSTLAGLSVLKTTLLGAVFVGLLAFAVVRRHTRVEEEAGRAELVGAAVIGRRATLVAALLSGLTATLLASVLGAAGLLALGFPVRGSITFGCGWLCAGLVMSGVTAVAAQLTSTARGCAGWALGTLGAAYLLRALGDATPELSWLSWLSPLGWVSRAVPYAADRWWVALLGIAAFVVLSVTAFALQARRDLGSGVLPARPGPGEGRIHGAGPLVLRMLRPSLIGWSIASLLFGALIAGLLESVGDMLADPAIADMLGKLAGGSGTLTEVFLATELRFFAVALAAGGVSIALRLVGEEISGRSELVLSSTTSRWRWYVAHLLAAVGAVTWLTLISVTLIGLVGPAVTERAPGLSQMLLAGVQILPAVWLVVGIALLLAGFSARAGWAAWTLLVGFFVLGELGSTLRLPGWLVDVSPFAHVPLLPMGHLRWDAWIGLSLITVLLLAAGLLRFQRRDLR